MYVPLRRRLLICVSAMVAPCRTRSEREVGGALTCVGGVMMASTEVMLQIGDVLRLRDYNEVIQLAVTLLLHRLRKQL